MWYVPLKGFAYLFYYSTEKGWWQSVLHSSYGMQPHKVHEGKETPKFGFLLGFLWKRCIGWWKGEKNEWSSPRGYVAEKQQETVQNTSFPCKSGPDTLATADVAVTFRAVKYLLIKAKKSALNPLKQDAEKTTAPPTSAKTPKLSTMTF